MMIENFIPFDPGAAQDVTANIIRRLKANNRLLTFVAIAGVGAALYFAYQYYTVSDEYV